MSDLTQAEVDALTGDDVAYWLSNPFMTPDLLVEKVRWWVSRAHEAGLADGWDERSKARPQYLGPDDGHWNDECMGWEDCYCGSFPNPYRDPSPSDA